MVNKCKIGYANNFLAFFLCYYLFGGNMKNDFDQELKYNLYRNIKNILHPTISKKNVSDYKIILAEDVMPIRVFYPKKISSLDKIVIYIHGEGTLTGCSGEYSNISSRIALDYNQLVISLDYENYKGMHLLELYNLFYETFKYIYIELLRNGISKENITLMGDSTGASAITSLINKMAADNIFVGRQILFYPLLSGEYFGNSKFSSLTDITKYHHELIPKISSYYTYKTKYKKDLKNENLFALLKKDFSTYPKTLIICGSTDPLIDEARVFAERLEEKATLLEVPFATHGFLKNTDFETIAEYDNQIKLFLK